MSKRVSNKKGQPSRNKAFNRVMARARWKEEKAHQALNRLQADAKTISADRRNFDKKREEYNSAGFLSRLKQVFRPRSA